MTSAVTPCGASTSRSTLTTCVRSKTRLAGLDRLTPSDFVNQMARLRFAQARLTPDAVRWVDRGGGTEGVRLDQELDQAFHRLRGGVLIAGPVAISLANRPPLGSATGGTPMAPTAAGSGGPATAT